MSGNVEFISTEFDIFAKKQVQSAILETNVVHYKPIATVDQNDLELLIPGDSKSYIDLDIKLYVKGRLLDADGKDLDASDFMAGTNNLLHSMFSQCSISLNGVNITPASELYPYRSYMKTLLTYCSDAANSHLTNAFWYLDEGDILAGDPTSTSIKKQRFCQAMGEAKREQSNRVIRASTRRHMQSLAISAVGIPRADKINQSQGRYLPHELEHGYKSKGELNF